jgi:hypothetical protein
MGAPSRGSAVPLLFLFIARNACTHPLNKTVHRAHIIDPRLGQRFGVARGWVVFCQQLHQKHRAVREPRPTNPFEDEDDDEYENDVRARSLFPVA